MRIGKTSEVPPVGSVVSYTGNDRQLAWFVVIKHDNTFGQMRHIYGMDATFGRTPDNVWSTVGCTWHEHPDSLPEPVKLAYMKFITRPQPW